MIRAALGFVDTVVILGIVYIEDIKSARPSSLLISYLLFSISFDATQIRTLWLAHRVVVTAVQSINIRSKSSCYFLRPHKSLHIKSPYKEYPAKGNGVPQISSIHYKQRFAGVTAMFRAAMISLIYNGT